MLIKLIDTAEAFYSMAAEWDALLAASARDNPFLSHAWQYAWWKTFANSSDQLRILAGYDKESGQLAGILPTYLSRSDKLFKTGTLTLLGTNQICSDFLGCFTMQGAEQKFFNKICSFLDDNKKEWQQLVFYGLESETPFCDFIVQKTGNSRKITTLNPDNCCPFISLPADQETYLDSLSSKNRSRLRQYHRQLERHGTTRTEQITDDSMIADALSDIFSMHNFRMHAKGTEPAISRSTYLKFHTEVCRSFLLRGDLRLLFLNVSGQRIAFVYQFNRGRRTYFYQTGFQNNWSQFSPGFLLTGHAIRQAIADSSTTFEFLRGNETYKYNWGVTGVRQLADIRMFSNTMAGNICYTAQACYQHGKNALKQIVPAAGWEQLRTLMHVRN